MWNKLSENTAKNSAQEQKIEDWTVLVRNKLKFYILKAIVTIPTLKKCKGELSFSLSLVQNTGMSKYYDTASGDEHKCLQLVLNKHKQFSKTQVRRL